MALNNRIVSIVDDEIDISKLFHDALCKIDGISVFSFNDTVKALEHFTTNSKEYVLVLSDYRMPDLSGLDFLRKVKVLNPHVRTVLMSAFNIEDDSLLNKYLIDEIINTFIRKPITMFTLCNEVTSQIHYYELSLTGNKEK